MQTFSYHPYGETMSVTSGPVYAEEPYRFAGNEIDMFGNYDFHARIYDPATGRFTTPDPLAEKYCSLSPYVYCADNPVNYVDPEGLSPIYNQYGQLMGTDENGLQGLAVFMYENEFKQNMSADEAAKLNRGESLLESDEVRDALTVLIVFHRGRIGMAI